jgi:hypothetical protein
MQTTMLELSDEDIGWLMALIEEDLMAANRLEGSAVIARRILERLDRLAGGPR